MPKISGVKKAQDRIRAMSGPKQIEFVGKALFAAGEKIKAEAQISLTTGAVSGINHKPSAPGSPPKNDSGTLARSIIVTQKGPLHVQVSANAPYAAIHEFGGTINHPGGTSYFIDEATGLAVFVPDSSVLSLYLPRTKPHTITMPERPFMGPAARKVRPEVVKLVGDAVRIAIRGKK